MTVIIVALVSLFAGLVIGAGVGFCVGLKVLAPTFYVFLRAVARARTRMIEQSDACKANPGIGKTYDGLDWAVAILDEETLPPIEAARRGTR